MFFSKLGLTWLGGSSRRSLSVSRQRRLSFWRKLLLLLVMLVLRNLSRRGDGSLGLLAQLLNSSELGLRGLLNLSGLVS